MGALDAYVNTQERDFLYSADIQSLLDTQNTDLSKLLVKLIMKLIMKIRIQYVPRKEFGSNFGVQRIDKYCIHIVPQTADSNQFRGTAGRM